MTFTMFISRAKMSCKRRKSVALTGLDIFKLLPKTNCGECGVPTCMAFAMKLAQKAADIADCPYASPNAIEVLGAASRPLIRTVKTGNADSLVEIGNETVMFRHDKTFVHPTAVAVKVSDSMSDEEITHITGKVREYCLERVGEELRLEFILVENTSDDPSVFAKAAKLVANTSGKAVILDSLNSDSLKAACRALGEDANPVIYYVDNSNVEEISEIAKEFKTSVVAKASNPDDLYDLCEKIKSLGINDIIMNLESSNIGATVQYNTILRNAALKNQVEAVGYPIINFLTNRTDEELVADASTLICKYASIMVIDSVKLEVLLPIMMLRQNIFTDPQKPIQVEPGLYPINDPDENSPVFVTTNFSLTYFLVSGELEGTGLPAWLLIVETEGMSVLTGWAAGKFNGDKIGAFAKEIDLNSKISNKTVCIPGYVASISGELEESMPGWKVLVASQEASDLPAFVKAAF